MKQSFLKYRDNAKSTRSGHLPDWAWAATKPAMICLALVVCALSALPARAQTVTINPQTVNYWTGVNTSNALGVGSNSVVMSGANGVATINFALAGQPVGLTTTFSTNSCTNTISLGLFLAATNVAAGAYPLTLSGSGAASYSTNVNLFVVPQWALTNGTANWGSGPNWSGGSAPGSSDSVYIEDFTGNSARQGFTNIVDSSRTIQSLILLGDNDANGSLADACAMQIPTGVTLSVLGTNGFAVGNKTSSSARPLYTFSGAGTLVVSNPAANFVVNNAGNSRPTTVLMTNLYNFSATVNRFGVGDVTLCAQGLFGTVSDNLSLAQTNQITALFADNYSGLSFNNSIQFAFLGDLGGGSVINQFALGISNRIYADSIGVSRGRSPGSGASPFAFFGPTLRFLPMLSNSVSPIASAYIRGTNGGRMSLLAVGVDSGTSANLNNCQGVVDLRGGVANLQVDQIWLGRDRTNSSAGRVLGGLYFDWGTVNANTVIIGNMQYTNTTALTAGYLLVGTNGTLNVNSNLVLGLTPANVTGFASQAAAVSGQVQINNGGTLRASQVTVGPNSTGNAITINAGGTLDVTNPVASSAIMLSGLTNNGGGLTLHVNGNSTLVYASNLTASAGSSINIASVSGISSFPATIHVISYTAATTPGNWGAGTVPAGLSATVANNPGNNSIDITLGLGSPKSVLWKAYANNTWDLSTYNWVDLNTGLHTNFATGDKVAFDDTASASSIIVSGSVVPSQAAGGMQMTNTTLAYTFTTASSGDGSGQILGGASLTKVGTNSLTVDLYAEFDASVNAGSLSTTAYGTIGSAIVAGGAALSNGGTVLGSLACSGTAVNSGTIDGALAVQTLGIVTNSATVNGSLSMQTSSLLYNAGTFYAIGSPTTGTNSTLVNNGLIYGSSLTIGGTLVSLPTVYDTTGGPGSINVGTLTINGTFEPGGNSIAITTVTDWLPNNSELGNPNGRVQLAGGSQTILWVNKTVSPENTVVLSQNQGFGPSEVAKGINGGRLVISNTGPAFVAGDTFQFFAAYYTGGNIGNAGLNTTNAYPVLEPSAPGPGLVWDLSNLYPGGTIGVINASADQMTLTHNATIIGTNLVTELSWPAGFIGNGWVQQQVNSLATGLSTNWTDLGPTAYVNDIFLTNVISANSAVFYRFVIP